MFRIGCCVAVLTARTDFVVIGSPIGIPQSSPVGCGIKSIGSVWVDFPL